LIHVLLLLATLRLWTVEACAHAHEQHHEPAAFFQLRAGAAPTGAVIMPVASVQAASDDCQSDGCCCHCRCPFAHGLLALPGERLVVEAPRLFKANIALALRVAPANRAPLGLLRPPIA
jgi:hypothetical protein